MTRSSPLLRSDTREQAGVWVLGAVFGLVPSILPVSWLTALLIGTVGVLLVRGWRLRVVLTAFVVAEVSGLPWPVAPLLAAACFFAFTPGSLRRLVRQRGCTSGRRAAWFLVVLVSVAAGTAVVALDWTTIRSGYTFAFPAPPPWSFPLVALGAALVNALGEEALWRGVLSDVGAPVLRLRAAVCLQSFSFGLAHFHGIPNGVLGVVAAAVYSALVYGISMRLGARGALVAHLLTDLVIFVVVVHFAQFAWSG